MLGSTQARLTRIGALAAIVLSIGFLPACSTSEPKSMVSKTKRSNEYFAESEYGVKASPRVTSKRTRLPRGGGRDQLGKPYQVRGKWYHPKEDKNYRKTGSASWYGDAFHGRLTANGEIYDQTHLTAAHPTMPLPSYARVTNAQNGTSVIVRVNDRGPYAHDRIIDLSRRAAEMLDYTHSGITKVKVEYVGRAPLDGHDEQYLVASYRPGDRGPDPSDGLPEGVMIAMNGATPSVNDTGQTLAFPGELTTSGDADITLVAFGNEASALPKLGPIVPERPAFDVMPETILVASAAMSYASSEPAPAATAFDILDPGVSPTPAAVGASFHNGNAVPYIAAGTFETHAQALAVASSLDGLGAVEIEPSDLDGAARYSVNLRASSISNLDATLQAAWDRGATDAFVVRD